MEQDAVGQIGERVVMRHIGDAGLGVLALGDIDDGDQNGVLVGERQPAGISEDFDFAAVGLDMAPGPVRLVFVADRARHLAVHVPFVARPQIEQRHALHARAAIAVMRAAPHR